MSAPLGPAPGEGAASPAEDAPRAADAAAGHDDGEGQHSLLEQVGTLALAVVIALSIRAFVVEPFRIPSGSMLPTLLIGDHLFVNKFVYGAKLPFSEARLPSLRVPERGEVVVFTVAKDGARTHPADRRPDLPREEFVKRIVGLPGDVVEVRGGGVWVNGERLDEHAVGEVFEDDVGNRLDVVEVSLPERSFRILDDPRVNGTPSHRIVVEPGRYLMLGDNRDHSKDSRVWGTVRLEEIKGPAFLLYWSWSFNGDWLELVNPLTWWNAETRWDRIGMRLDS